MAAAILFLYAASHIGFLRLADVSHDLPNAVFPFLENRALYVIVASVEALAGVLCIRYRGTNAANAVIFAFIGTMLWYRGMLTFLDANETCSCLGLVARLFQLTKAQEKIIPLLTLGVLALMTTPSWGRRFRLSRKTCGAATGILALFAGVGAHQGRAEHSIEIDGEINVRLQNPVNSKSYKGTESHGHFHALVSGNTFNFRIENIDRPAWWISYIFDGHNGYYLSPFGGSYYDLSVPRNDLDVADVSDRSCPLLANDDWLGISLVWLTYGSAPVPGRDSPPFTGPLPWLQPRINPGAYGYRWLTTASANPRFLRNGTIKRDRKLDLGENEELLRDDLNPPDGPRMRNMYITRLKERRDFVPTNFTEASYECTEWGEVDGMPIPRASSLKVSLGPHPSYRHPWIVFTLQATAFKAVESDTVAPPVIRAATRVHDYRFRGARGDRVFKYAEYSLSPGDHWRSRDDAELIAVREKYLESGPRLGAVSLRHWIGWVFLLFTGALAAWMRQTRRKAALRAPRSKAQQLTTNQT